MRALLPISMMISRWDTELTTIEQSMIVWECAFLSNKSEPGIFAHQLDLTGKWQPTTQTYVGKATLCWSWLIALLACKPLALL